jgi:hypothetical protein
MRAHTPQSQQSAPTVRPRHARLKTNRPMAPMDGTPAHKAQMKNVITMVITPTPTPTPTRNQINKPAQK